MSAGQEEPFARKVLLVDIDDLGWDDLLEAVTMGIAPQIDYMLSHGTVFTHFYAASLCSIFRARALTGCESIRPQNYCGENVKFSGLQPHYSAPAGPWITSGMPGWKVKRGKWHLGHSPEFPTNVVASGGFNEFSGTIANLNNAPGDDYFSWKRFTGASSGWTLCTTFATNQTTTEALGDIAGGAEFVHVSYHAIHLPLDVYPPVDGQVQPSTSVHMKFHYLAHLDLRLGELVSAAVAAGYVVLVACDNGSLDEGKGTYTEGGICTPCWAIGAGVPVKTVARLVQATDLFATVRELRGAPTITTPDSHSFADEILSVFQGSAPRSAITCSSYPSVGEPPVPGTVTRCARDQRYKLLDDQGAVSFFDLYVGESMPITPTTPRELAAFAALTAALPV